MKRFEIIEIGKITNDYTISSYGEKYRSVDIKIKEYNVTPYKMNNQTFNYQMHNVAMSVKEDVQGHYLDFTDTKFDELGIIKIQKG